MNELNIQFIVFGKLIWLSIFSLAWGLGGYKWKFVRRVIGSLWLTTGYLIFSLFLSRLSLWYLICAPLLFGASSLGYGAENTNKKIVRRAISGLALSSASLPVFIVNQAWLLCGIHYVICTGLMVLLGVLNPFHGEDGARSEESTIAVGVGLIPIMTV